STDTASTVTPTLSLHDALPILWRTPCTRFEHEPAHRARSSGRLAQNQQDDDNNNADSLVFWVRFAGAHQYVLRAHTDSCGGAVRSEEHTSELQSRFDLVCRLLL